MEQYPTIRFIVERGGDNGDVRVVVDGAHAFAQVRPHHRSEERGRFLGLGAE